MAPARCGTDPRPPRTRRVRSWAGSDAHRAQSTSTRSRRSPTRQGSRKPCRRIPGYGDALTRSRGFSVEAHIHAVARLWRRGSALPRCMERSSRAGLNGAVHARRLRQRALPKDGAVVAAPLWRKQRVPTCQLLLFPDRRPQPDHSRGARRPDGSPLGRDVVADADTPPC